jgi:hypothetical protein
MNCLRRTDAATFVGYAYYEGSLNPDEGPYPVHDPATDFCTGFLVSGKKDLFVGRGLRARDPSLDAQGRSWGL